ncbi:MAG TPA: D-glycerate dehydrogenase, partial [Anaerolineae bacterium]|nr:D-glycerate dehydrogenase [Anaerolineae bacterium]
MKQKVYVTRHLPEAALNELVQGCDVEIWDHETPPPYDLIVEKVRDKEGLLCLLTDRIDAALMDASPRLKVISQCAVGFDNVDLVAATERGIPVGNTPGVLTDATADFAFTLLMAAARRVGEAIDYVRAGHWQTWGLTLLLGQDVYGATLGLIGFGRIGQAVARRARGFDMRVLYYDVMRQPEAEAELRAEYRPLDELLQESDYVSLHVSLTEQTQGFMDARAFALMKPTAILINTSRGPVVDTEALYQALNAGDLAYAALDVTDPEPLPAGHKLLELPNLIVAPHIASATVSSRTL